MFIEARLGVKCFLLSLHSSRHKSPQTGFVVKAVPAADCQEDAAYVLS